MHQTSLSGVMHFIVHKKNF